MKGTCRQPENGQKFITHAQQAGQSQLPKRARDAPIPSLRENPVPAHVIFAACLCSVTSAALGILFLFIPLAVRQWK